MIFSDGIGLEFDMFYAVSMVVVPGSRAFKVCCVHGRWRSGVRAPVDWRTERHFRGRGHVCVPWGPMGLVESGMSEHTGGVPAERKSIMIHVFCENKLFEQSPQCMIANPCKSKNFA